MKMRKQKKENKKEKKNNELLSHYRTTVFTLRQACLTSGPEAIHEESYKAENAITTETLRPRPNATQQKKTKREKNKINM